jgi:hypothetical protein
MRNASHKKPVENNVCGGDIKKLKKTTAGYE